MMLKHTFLHPKPRFCGFIYLIMHLKDVRNMEASGGASTEEALALSQQIKLDVEQMVWLFFYS